MTRENNAALREILRCVKAGYSYGIDRPDMKYPYFDARLYKTSQGNLGWRHYGSAANKMTLADLEWVLTVIFKTTPVEFLRDNIRSDASAITC